MLENGDSSAGPTSAENPRRVFPRWPMSSYAVRRRLENNPTNPRLNKPNVPGSGTVVVPGERKIE